MKVLLRRSQESETPDGQSRIGIREEYVPPFRSTDFLDFCETNWTFLFHKKHGPRPEQEENKSSVFVHYFFVTFSAFVIRHGFSLPQYVLNSDMI